MSDGSKPGVPGARFSCVGAATMLGSRLMPHHLQQQSYVASDRGVIAVIHGYGGQSSGDWPVNVVREELDSALRTQTQPADAVMTALASASTRLQNPPPGVSPRAHSASVTAIALDRSRATIIHVGSCRAYLLRGGVLTGLTDDHVLELPDDRFEFPVRLRALTADEFAPDVVARPVSRGDTLIILSEAAVRAVVRTELLALARNSPPQLAADSIVALAHERVAHQSSTAVIASVDADLDLNR